jgi:hypothetical protein
MTTKVISSAVPIQDTIAPDLTIICKLNQLTKSNHVDISFLIIMQKVYLYPKLQSGKKYSWIPW